LDIIGIETARTSLRQVAWRTTALPKTVVRIDGRYQVERKQLRKIEGVRAKL
jgi:hypothetical protein